MLGIYNIVYYHYSDEGGDADITPSFIVDGISDEGMLDGGISDCVRLFENARYGIKNMLIIGTNIRITSHGFWFIALSIFTHIIM